LHAEYYLAPEHDEGTMERSQWSLHRVLGPNLDPAKSWYALSKELCGVNPRDFAKNSFFKYFPDEIAFENKKDLIVINGGKRLPFAAVLSEKGEPLQRQPTKIHLATTLGLFYGLLRQRAFPMDDFHQSSIFKCVSDFVNGLRFDDMVDGQSSTMCSNKQENIAKTDCKLTSISTSGKPKVESHEMNISELKASPMGPTTTKKSISARCSNLYSYLSDVCSNHRESLASVLGNTFIYGNETEQDAIRDILSEIGEKVIESKGAQNVIQECFSDEIHQKVLRSMRVPDWALLYLKLESRMPDAAWQTLLNITHLGKSGVSIPSMLFEK